MNAAEWLGQSDASGAPVALLGAPISRASISLSDAWATPSAFRQALTRFPLWDAEHSVDLTTLGIHDRGDIDGDRGDANAAAAHQRLETAVQQASTTSSLVIVIGGDNSLTRPAMTGAMAAHPDLTWGLITLDAHHDVRDAAEGGPRNGTPVRDLIQAGLAGRRVAQIGIHPFGNAREHADWAREHGIHRYSIQQVMREGALHVVDAALGALRDEGVNALYVDIDIDVLDRAYAPACPGSMPAGMLPGDLFSAVYRLGADPLLRVADLCEVDATQDVNGITVRAMAQAFLNVCSGRAAQLREH